MHVLRAGSYEVQLTSRWAPELDLALVAQLLDCENINEPIKRIQAFAATLTPPSP